MEIIIVSIPLFISIIAFFFYFLVKPIDKILRFIPYVLVSIIIEDSYWLYMISDTVNNSAYNIVKPFFSILFMLFLFMLLYELIDRKIISQYLLLINFIPLILFVAMFLMIRVYFTTTIDSENIYISGVLLSLIYLIILSFKIHKNKFVNRRIYGVTYIIMLPIVIIILIGISACITFFFGIFFNLIFYLFKVIELITIVVLYFYLFSIYKEKLEALGEERFKSFETLYNIPKITPKKNEQLETDKVNYDAQELYSPPTIRKYQKSLLNTRKIKENEQIISNFFKHNREDYLDVDFNMQKLSLMTGIPSYYLSQTFNIALKTNFKAYLNKKRIEFACKLLENKEKQISVTELCFLCGYKSRTSFYDQFKKVTGYTLAEYKNIMTQNL